MLKLDIVTTVRRQHTVEIFSVCCFSCAEVPRGHRGRWVSSALVLGDEERCCRGGII